MRRPIGALVLSAVGLIGITSFEGYRSAAYVPVPGDVPTIGFGHTEGVAMGDKIDVPTGLEKLLEDTNTAQQAVRDLVAVAISQKEFDAYTSFVFNVGRGAFSRSTLLKKLNAGDRIGACRELPRWVYAGGRKQAGLVRRRAVEMKTCLQGVNGV